MVEDLLVACHVEDLLVAHHVEALSQAKDPEVPTARLVLAVGALDTGLPHLPFPAVEILHRTLLDQLLRPPHRHLLLDTGSRIRLVCLTPAPHPDL
mmetsp:Transcript_9027/g.27950  ORF Transcript_9027/g.27950 Transcript_9027/m.27950 type:complete len:96 (+) Transcript_9027:194-481(+)